MKDCLGQAAAGRRLGFAAMPSSGTVVITGASTGIGRATALRLARAGFDVLAGVRREEDGADAARRRTAASSRCSSTSPTPVRSPRLAARVGGAPLAGLVNNAGIAVAGPLEGVPLDLVRRQYEVNVFGLLAVTQALLEPIRAGHGRIVNIGSIGGRINTPFVGPYSSSKAAVRSLSAALRRELRPWDIRVALVEPGALDTPIWRKGEAGRAGDDRRAARPRAHPLRPSARGPRRRHAQDRRRRQLARRRRAGRRARAHRRAPEGRSTPSAARPASRARCTASCPRARSTRSSRGR